MEEAPDNRIVHFLSDGVRLEGTLYGNERRRPDPLRGEGRPVPVGSGVPTGPRGPGTHGPHLQLAGGVCPQGPGDPLYGCSEGAIDVTVANTCRVPPVRIDDPGRHQRSGRVPSVGGSRPRLPHRGRTHRGEWLPLGVGTVRHRRPRCDQCGRRLRGLRTGAGSQGSLPADLGADPLYRREAGPGGPTLLQLDPGSKGAPAHAQERRRGGDHSGRPEGGGVRGHRRLRCRGRAGVATRGRRHEERQGFKESAGCRVARCRRPGGKRAATTRRRSGHRRSKFPPMNSRILVPRVSVVEDEAKSQTGFQEVLERQSPDRSSARWAQAC
jgi:hypothetical protein